MTSQEIMAPEAPLYSDTPTDFGGRRALPEHANIGTIAIEQDRAVAEAQGKLIVAQRCPRNVREAEQEMMRACQEMSLAGEAFYQYKRGSENVRGPSIRLAEELARCWGNVEYGIRELSQSSGVSEMQAFAWDLQRNTLSTQSFTVRHIRDTRSGGTSLTSQRDIYELTANMGGRRLRARILAVMPKWLVAMAVAECEKTIATKDKRPIAERMRAMTAEFLRLNVTAEMLESKLGKKLPLIADEDFITLRGLFTSLRDGQTTIAEQFGVAENETGTQAGANLSGAIESAIAATTPAATAEPQQPAQKSELPQQAATKQTARTKPSTAPAPQPQEPSPAPAAVAEPEGESVF